MAASSRTASTKKKKAARRPRKPTPARLRKLLAYEYGLWERGVVHVAGVDEVGRGPLAGPVLAAAVILPHGSWIMGVGDSKKLTPERRVEVADRIVQGCVAWAIGAASAKEIDRLNIRRATALAMERALRRLPVRAEHWLVDGLHVPELGAEAQTAVIDGDECVHCIGAASIVAKVTRDRLMERLAVRYPAYGWERNRGYATAEHLEALDRFGYTPHHRRSFQPAQLTLEALFDGRQVL